MHVLRLCKTSSDNYITIHQVRRDHLLIIVLDDLQRCDGSIVGQHIQYEVIHI